MTVSTSAMPEQIDSALRWRCRRGMLELDILLNNFVEKDYVQLTSQQKTSFDQLLDYPDQLLFDLLLGYMPSSDPKITELVQKIRHTASA